MFRNASSSVAPSRTAIRSIARTWVTDSAGPTRGGGRTDERRGGGAVVRDRVKDPPAGLIGGTAPPGDLVSGEDGHRARQHARLDLAGHGELLLHPLLLDQVLEQSHALDR